MFRKLEKEIPGEYNFLLKKLNFAHQTALSALITDEIFLPGLKIGETASQKSLQPTETGKNQEEFQKEAKESEKKPEDKGKETENDQEENRREKKSREGRRASVKNQKKSFVHEASRIEKEPEENFSASQQEANFSEVQEKIFEDLNAEAWDVCNLLWFPLEIFLKFQEFRSKFEDLNCSTKP